MNGELKASNVFLKTIRGAENLIYEVIRIENSIPLFMEDHFDRIERSIQLVKGALPLKRDEMELSIHKLIASNRLEKGALKILYYYTPDPLLIVHLMKEYKPSSEEYLRGIDTLFFHTSRTNPNAKVWNPEFRNKTAEKIERGSVFEVVLVNSEGFITEGSRSNIFFIKGHEVYTTPESYVLAGITRKKVISVCESLTIKVRFELIYYKDVSKFDSVFFTGTTRKMVPARQIDNIPFQVDNPIFNRIRENFEKLEKKYVLEQTKK